MDDNSTQGLPRSEEVLECVSSQNIDKFKTLCPPLGNENETKSGREILLRKLLDANESQSCDYFTLFDFAAECVTHDLCFASTLPVLISNALDMATLDSCAEIFSYVEGKLVTLTSEPFFSSCKFCVLKMCNGLLRRLSSQRNTELGARVQLFLARFFPFDEKSGVNLLSEFNTDNVTVFDADAGEAAKNIVAAAAAVAAAAVDDDDDEEGMIHEDDGSGKMKDTGDDDDEKDESKRPVDYVLYRKFWSLQNYFMLPVQCYDAAKWETFVDAAEEVMRYFEHSKLKKDASRPESSDDFFAKHLTSDRVFNLQLGDSNFRRNVLLQFLLAFQYFTGDVKSKTSKCVLSDKQTDWIGSTKKRVYKILSGTPPNGTEFLRIIRRILRSESKWNSWKNAGCPDFVKVENDKKQEIQEDQKVTRKRKRSLYCDLKLNSKIRRLGNPSIDRLWNSKAVREYASKDHIPAFNDYFDEAIGQLDPEAGIEDQYKLINDPTYSWKALRVLRMNDPRVFVNQEKDERAIKTIPQFLQKVLSKNVPKTEMVKNTETNDAVRDGGKQIDCPQ